MTDHAPIPFNVGDRLWSLIDKRAGVVVIVDVVDNTRYVRLDGNEATKWLSVDEMTLADPVALADRPSPFTTKDSGGRVDFPTGSRRDSQDGKGRFDLLPLEALLRWAQLLERGAAKYGENNWTLGQPYSRVFSSLLRHALQAAAGHTDEDHLAAVMFNAAALITFDERITAGDLPGDLNDMPWAA